MKKRMSYPFKVHYQNIKLKQTSHESTLFDMEVVISRLETHICSDVVGAIVNSGHFNVR